MDTAVIKQQALKFNRSRNNLLAVVAFTALNLILTAFNANIYLLFSATTPQVVFGIGQSFADELQNMIDFTYTLIGVGF